MKTQTKILFAVMFLCAIILMAMTLLSPTRMHAMAWGLDVMVGRHVDFSDARVVSLHMIEAVGYLFAGWIIMFIGVLLAFNEYAQLQAKRLIAMHTSAGQHG